VRLAVCALVLCGLAATAHAYPQFQLSTGTDTCKQCHYSPGGGGLINDYGRDEVAGLSWSDAAGDGRFLHGAWTPPSAFQLGADLRFATGLRADPVDVYDGGDSPLGPYRSDVLAFPMQGDLYLRPKVGPVALHLTAGLRGAARGGPASLAERLASREHYLMYEPDDGTWYARAGRFYPVFGLRTQDHTAYVRRHLQMYLFEEPYGAAWGKYAASWELHVSAFTRAPSPFLGVATDSGVAAYWEKRNEESTAAYAAQTKLTVSDNDRRAWAGGVYKKWMEASKLLLLGELDLGVQAFPDGGGKPHYQMIGYAGATYFAQQGLMVGGVIQAYDPDLGLASTSRSSVEANVQWFPVAHLELHLLTRMEAVGLNMDDPQLLALLQLHYFL
jgi:hypothetical protein